MKHAFSVGYSCMHRLRCAKTQGAPQAPVPLDMLPPAMSAMCYQVLETGPCVDEEEAERAQQQVHLPSSVEAKRGDKLQYV